MEALDYKLHTPVGVQDFLPNEYFLKKEIRNITEDIFASFNYKQVSTPTFEYLEVFEGKGSLGLGKIFKIIDKDGASLALRADTTPAIARIVSTTLANENLPLRFCYFENAFRNDHTLQGKLREFTQAGVELVGVNSVDSDFEILLVLIKCLRAFGLSDFKIRLGHVGFVKGILEEAEKNGFSEENAARALLYILNKEFVDLEKFIDGSGLDSNTKKIFRELKFLSGEKDVLEYAKTIVQNEKSLNAIKNLEKIFDLVNEHNLEEYISFDLSLTGHFDYYTGIIFAAFAYGTGFSVADGGRYDNLIEKFGRKMQAVGFAIKINEIINAIGQNKKLEKKAVTLVACSDSGRKNAFTYADNLRGQNIVIENSFIKNDLEKNIEFAKERDIAGILYFGDDDLVTVVDLEKNERNTVSINEL